jgi:hypothetical protein
MAKYLVEVSHTAERVACLRSIQILLSTGNHFLMNADWGCHDGVHKAWFIIDVDSKEEAMRIIPQSQRKDATIIQLEKWNLKEVDEMLADHTLEKIR